MRTISATDIGLSRSENQDIVRVDELYNGILAVVCDGMGGERSGQKASKIALNAVFSKFTKDYDSSMNSFELRRILLSSILQANSEVYNSSREDTKDFGMGTTCVAAFVTDDTIHLANVGDSRAYLLENGTIKQLTMDHTFVRMLYERGDIKEEEMQYHPQRNMLTKAIGVEKSVTPDYFEIKHQKNFKLMLCSDGLSGYCTSEEMYDILKNDDIKIASEELIQLAIDKGGRDNITLAIIAD